MSYLGLPVHMTVTPEGRVGIGSSQPRTTLDVIGSIYATGNITGSNLTIFGDTVTLATVTSNTERVVITNNTPGPALTVRQAGEGVGFAIMEAFDEEAGIAFKIADGGNIGIGTSTPTFKLHVHNGDIFTSGAIYGNAANVTGLASSAYTDTTNATNISSGTLHKDRVAPVLNGVSMAGPVGVGTSAVIRSDFDVVSSGTSFTLPMLPPIGLTGATSTITTSPQSRLNGTYQIVASFEDAGANNLSYFAMDGNSNTFWATKPEYLPSFVRGGTTPVATISVVDSDTTTQTFGHHITVQTPRYTLIKGYTLQRSSNLSETPGSWRVFGSSNNLTWSLIDSKTAYAWASEVAHISLSNQSWYQYYRLQIIEAAAGDGVTLTAPRIRDWKLIGDVQVMEGTKMFTPFSIWQNQSSSAPIMMTDMDTARIGVGTTAPLDALHIHNGNLRVSASTGATILSTNVATSRVGFGTTNPQERVHVTGGNVRIGNLAGTGVRTVSVDAQGTLTVSVSDSRLKENVQPMFYGLVELSKLRPVQFEWRDKERYGARAEYGLIAQEVATIMPDMVSQNVATGMYELDYVKLVPLLIKGMQDLLGEVESLRKLLRP